MHEFKVGDKAVFPAHGVGVIESVESREIGGSRQDFYVLQIISSGARLMVPTAGCTKAGMRNLISDPEIEGVYDILKTRKKINQTTWNRRFREYNDKLRTGSVSEVAEVYRDLCYLKTSKDLSYGEKRMLEKARELVVTEISAASRRETFEVEKKIDSLLLH